MKLNLTKDLCFFDVESTGLNILRDRIIQLAIIKAKADGSPDEELNMLINPGMVFISQEAYEVHGISAKDVANKPTFDTNGGLCLGRPLLPSIDSIIADSSPHIYAPAPLLK